MLLRSVILAIATAVVAMVAISGPWASPVRGLSFDSLVWLRQSLFGAQHDRDQSPSVVIAIDEETYRREPFQSTPKVMWTDEIATILDSVTAGGAAVVGIDLILPTSLESRIRGIDRNFLQSLRRNAQKGKIVLSKVQHSRQPILPAVGQRFAVGAARNIRSTNVYTDDVGVVRGVPVSFPVPAKEGPPRYEPSLSLELAQRALGDRLTFAEDGRGIRDGVELPTREGNNLLINFDDNQRGIPTYSFADMHACAETGDHDFFARNFAGKIVLIGLVTDLEDRKLTSLRFATAPDGEAFGERCRLEPQTERQDSPQIRDSLPGVYLHAFAVNNLIRGNFLRDIGPSWSALVTFLVALAMAGVTLWLTAPIAGLLTVGIWAAWAGFATMVFETGTLVPLYEPPAAATLAFAIMSAYRFMVTDRDKHLLRQMFGHYLSPTVIGQMVARKEMPTLGGEEREMTVWISDLENYSTYSELLSPPELVELLNRVYTVMTNTVEEYDGFVAQFVGDAVVAAFGAPLDDPNHARNAVTSALMCKTRVEALNDDVSLPGNLRLRNRYGISTGQLLVGNIGSERRLSYSIVGDDINLSSRLEGVNKMYGSTILVNEITKDMCGDGIVFREVDIVRVKGRDTPVRIFEPVGFEADVDDMTRSRIDAFAAALADYRGRRFTEATAGFAALAEHDPVSRGWMERAQEFANDPPPDDWDAINNLTSK
ncbi:MAG: adenylate/guanylate cyclase domain-containing protein [Alphaproteobacteria bacterium]